MTVRLTSRIAYKDITESGNANTQRRIICETIWEKGEAMSLREISKATRYDINAVSGRVNELKKSNMLHEHNKRKCFITDRLITPVYIAMDYVPENISIVKDMMKENDPPVISMFRKDKGILDGEPSPIPVITGDRDTDSLLEDERKNQECSDNTMKKDEKDVYEEEHKYRPSLPENKSKGWI